MKAIKIVLAAALMAVCASASAQFTGGGASSGTAAVDTDGWSSFYVEYNPMTMKNDYKGADDESFTGISIGYSSAFSVSQDLPIFIEAGIAGQYAWWSDSDDDEDGSEERTISLISAKVPVNLAYKYTMPNSSFTIIPFAGFTGRFNVSGKAKYEWESEYYDESESEDFDLFDKKDMDGEPWKRFQLGWQIGAKAILGEKCIIGVSYGKDFSEIVKKCKFETISISIGLLF